MPAAYSPDGTRIHYDVYGQGDRWVVLIQGLGLSSRHWGDQPQVVASAGFRVLTLDNIGTGRSGRVRRPYPIARMARDVITAMDAAGAPSASVAGISMGGMIAQEVALRHANRVETLTLLATTPGIPHGRLPSPAALAMLGGVPLFHARGEARQAYRRMFFGTRPEHEARVYVNRLMEIWDTLPDFERAAPLDFALQFRAAATHSAGFRLRRLTMPVHVAAGADDLVIPAHNAQILGRLIPHASVELLPNVGHAMPVEHPDLLVRTLSRLVRLAA